MNISLVDSGVRGGGTQASTRSTTMPVLEGLQYGGGRGRQTGIVWCWGGGPHPAWLTCHLPWGGEAGEEMGQRGSSRTGRAASVPEKGRGGGDRGKGCGGEGGRDVGE
jgi:hypothetical protein